jgi:hypothetical protein
LALDLEFGEGRAEPRRELAGGSHRARLHLRFLSKQDFGNTKRGGYQAGKVDGFRDKEFYTCSGLLNKK